MRRIDVWVGRIAAVAGLIYVILCRTPPGSGGFSARRKQRGLRASHA